MNNLMFSGNSKTKRHISLLSVLLLILFIRAPQLVYAVDQEEASTLLQTGEAALTSTFENILRADNLGANVSPLLPKLNTATEFLEQASVFLKKDQFDDVVTFASHSITLIEEVNQEAIRQIKLQSTQRTSTFRLNLILTIVGIVGFSLFIVLLWRWFKDYYLQRVQNSNPEVSHVVES